MSCAGRKGQPTFCTTYKQALLSTSEWLACCRFNLHLPLGRECLPMVIDLLCVVDKCNCCFLAAAFLEKAGNAFLVVWMLDL